MICFQMKASGTRAFVQVPDIIQRIGKYQLRGSINNDLSCSSATPFRREMGLAR